MIDPDIFDIPVLPLQIVRAVQGCRYKSHTSVARDTTCGSTDADSPLKKRKEDKENEIRGAQEAQKDLSDNFNLLVEDGAEHLVERALEYLPVALRTFQQVVVGVTEQACTAPGATLCGGATIQGSCCEGLNTKAKEMKERLFSPR